MYKKEIPGFRRLQLHFGVYHKEMRDIWESYCLIDYYMPTVHRKVKNDEMEAFSMPYLLQPNHRKRYSKEDTYGAISRMQGKSNPRRALIEAVSTFEDYLSYLVWRVYKDYPRKLSGSDPDTPQMQVKLIDMILESADKEEMLDRVTEERIRGMFYGNPLDFFLKEKVRLDFGDEFKNKFCYRTLYGPIPSSGTGPEWAGPHSRDDRAIASPTETS